MAYVFAFSPTLLNVQNLFLTVHLAVQLLSTTISVHGLIAAETVEWTSYNNKANYTDCTGVKELKGEYVNIIEV